LFGAFLFLADLLLKIGYFRSSKFIDVEVRNFYLLFLIARPVFVLLYHMFSFGINTHKVVYLYLKERKIARENQVINQEIELSNLNKPENPFEKMDDPGK
jgi:hypothetical protein